MLNSPRTLEACRRLGIDLADLDPVPESVVKAQLVEREKNRNVPPILIEIRKKHYDEKRVSKINLLKQVNLQLHKSKNRNVNQSLKKQKELYRVSQQLTTLTIRLNV